MVSRRPFESKEDLFKSADDAWDQCGPEDWHEAFAHHPRIGANVSGREATEQAGAQSASLSVKDELARVNREYEERFGHIYIVCATGKSAEEMLSIANQRLANDPESELRIAADEQRKIMQLRLRKLLS
jgi:2-oxo-4-hydroxy-4-carboxy-5-ureidoimidazoline decarboxylase